MIHRTLSLVASMLLLVGPAGAQAPSTTPSSSPLVSAALQQCRVSFKGKGSAIRGSKFTVAVDLRDATPAEAIERLAAFLREKSYTVTAADADAGTLSAEVRTTSGGTSDLTFAATRREIGTNLVTTLKLGIGTGSDDDAIRLWLCGLVAGFADAQPSPSATPAGSVEERLRQLEELRSKGLVTEEEYERKRAEILRDF